MATTISDLIADAQNANVGNELGDRALDNSLDAHGFIRPIVADRNGVLIAGNGTHKAALRHGYTNVIEVESDGDAVIVHKRRDLDFNSKDPAIRAKTRGASLADNQVARVRQNIDMALARQQIVTCAIVPASAGFTHAEIVQPVQIDTAAHSLGEVSDEPAERKERPPAPEVPRIRQVVIDCKDEEEQQSIYEMLTGLGITPTLRTL